MIDFSSNGFYTFSMKPVLLPRRSGGGTTREIEQGLWRLEIPKGPGGAYRWAQLDDYMEKSRRDFPWRPPLRLELRSRVSHPDLPGTWGFGLWNDPFSASLGVGGTAARLPALFNTAWFFYGAPPNYLAFRDDHPAQGFLAATFAAPSIPALLLAPGALAAPLLAVRLLARRIRGLMSWLIRESGARITLDPTEWRSYQLEWQQNRVIFRIDGAEVFATPVSPRAPLGLVLWIDNQYAAFPPSGKLSMGTSSNPETAWLELSHIEVFTNVS